jgi:hypothetical protein
LCQEFLGLYNDSYAIQVLQSDDGQFIYFYQLESIGGDDVYIVFDDESDMERFNMGLSEVDKPFYDMWSIGKTDSPLIQDFQLLDTKTENVTCGFKHNGEWYFDYDVTLSYEIKRGHYNVTLTIKTDTLVSGDVSSEGGKITFDSYDMFSLFSVNYHIGEYHFKTKSIGDSYKNN